MCRTSLSSLPAWPKTTKKSCTAPTRSKKKRCGPTPSAPRSPPISRLYVRTLGYPARAHHNGGSEVQAIPIFYQVGFGELGRHGSLINEKYGASFRPGFVTTDLPLVEDQPREFGVQDVCMNCNVCQFNCPGDAIPQDHVVTHGIKRWLIDLEKCYPYSRLRDEYCHLCVDVCPYNVKSHPGTYKAFMKERKQVGYKTPKSW